MFNNKLIDLDNIESLNSLDTKGQLSWMENWPIMILESFNKGKNINILKEIRTKQLSLNYTKNFKQIGICGMGGSGISGEYIQSYLKEVGFSVPINLIREPRLPSNFNSDTLILIVSYSGNTRETLTCLYESLKKNLSVVLISSGGICQELSEQSKIPLVLLPKGLVQRAAFPFLFGSITGVLYRIFSELSFLEKDILTLTELLKVNTSYGSSKQINSNLAKQLALKWLNTLPIFISEYQCLGMRMKGQLNENSKQIAFFDTFPEMMHNTTQSWQDEKLGQFPFHFIRTFIKNDLEMKKKTSYGWELAKYQTTGKVDDLDFSKVGETILHRLILVTYLVDYVSIYLALLRNFDPSKAEIIVGMKQKFDPELSEKFDIRSAILSLIEN